MKYFFFLYVFLHISLNVPIKPANRNSLFHFMLDECTFALGTLTSVHTCFMFIFFRICYRHIIIIITSLWLMVLSNVTLNLVIVVSIDLVQTTYYLGIALALQIYVPSSIVYISNLCEWAIKIAASISLENIKYLIDYLNENVFAELFIKS